VSPRTQLVVILVVVIIININTIKKRVRYDHQSMQSEAGKTVVQ